MLKNEFRFYRFLVGFFLMVVFSGLCVVCYLIQDKIYTDDEGEATYPYPTSISSPVYVEEDFYDEVEQPVEEERTNKHSPPSKDEESLNNFGYHIGADDEKLFCPDYMPMVNIVLDNQVGESPYDD